MNDKKIDTKTRTINKLSLAFFRLEALRGHNRWSVVELAKSADVSRSLIYNYMGNTKESITESCLDVFLGQFYGCAPQVSDEEFRDNLLLNIENNRRLIIKNGDVAVFYMKWRTRHGKISEKLIKYEKLFQSRLQKCFSHVSPADIIILHAFLHGLVTAPFGSDKISKKAVSSLLNGYLF